MPEQGYNPRAADKIFGKRLVFKRDGKGMSYDLPAPEDGKRHDYGFKPFPEATKVEVEIENDAEAEGKYEALHEEWERKNELLRATEALGAFSLEGGQELIAVFGVEKVAKALEKVLAGPIDERTGLYMLVRTLEPNLKKRELVYKNMLKSADADSKSYAEGSAGQKTTTDRKKYRDLAGGDFAPTNENVVMRKMRIREYQMYDRAAYSVVGSLVNAMERAVTGQQESKKWSLQQLKGKFSADAMVKGISNFDGSLTKWISLRFERVARTEARLEEKRVKLMDALSERYKERVEEIRAPFNERLDALLDDYHDIFEDLELGSKEAADIMIKAEEAFRKVGDDIRTEAAEEVRNTLGVYSKQIDKLLAFDVFKDE